MPDHHHTGNWRHWLGFIASGVAAFATDAGVLELLLRFTELSPLAARLISIPMAMVVGWRMHRRLTFGLSGLGTLREFLSFASVSWAAAALNYGTFAVLVLIFPAMPPLLGVFLSSGVAMIFSYVGYRFLVFLPLILRHSARNEEDAHE